MWLTFEIPYEFSVNKSSGLERFWLQPPSYFCWRQRCCWDPYRCWHVRLRPANLHHAVRFRGWSRDDDTTRLHASCSGPSRHARCLCFVDSKPLSWCQFAAPSFCQFHIFFNSRRVFIGYSRQSPNKKMQSYGVTEVRSFSVTGYHCSDEVSRLTQFYVAISAGLLHSLYT